MTVAAIVLVPDAAAALGELDGEPAIRRVAHAAWSGGAMPVVLVAPHDDGRLADAVTDSPVTLVRPAAGQGPGIAWFVDGARGALAAVAETTAGLLWPFRYAWVDPETVTSLVEAHGATPEAIIRPAYAGQAGFPILIPLAHLERLAGKIGQHGAEAVATVIAEGAPERILELGDPGIVFDLATARADLPGYQGPPEPAGGPPPEWNSTLGAQAQQSGEPAR